MRTRLELPEDESSESPQAARPRASADAAKAAAAWVRRLEGAICLRAVRPCLVVREQTIRGLLICGIGCDYAQKGR